MRKKAGLNLPSLLDIILIMLFGQIIYSLDMVPKAQTELNATNEELASATVKLTVTNEEIVIKKTELADLQKTVNTALADKDKLTAETKALSDVLKTTHAELGQAKAQNIQLNADNKKLEAENTTLKTNVASLTKEIKGKTELKEKTELETDKLKEKLKEITGKYVEHYKKYGEDLTFETVLLPEQIQSTETMPSEISKSLNYTASATKELKENLKTPEDALKLALLVKSVKDNFAILNASMKDGEFELEGKKITYDIITKQNGEKDSLELKPKLRTFLKREVSSRAIVMLKFDPDMYLFLSKQAREVMDSLNLVYTTTHEFTETLDEQKE